MSPFNSPRAVVEWMRRHWPHIMGDFSFLAVCSDGLRRGTFIKRNHHFIEAQFHVANMRAEVQAGRARLVKLRANKIYGRYGVN